MMVGDDTQIHLVDVPSAMIRYLPHSTPGQWRGILLGNVEIKVRTERVAARGSTGQAVSVGEDLVYWLQGSVDNRCLRAVQDMPSLRGPIEITIADAQATSTVNFSANASVDIGMIENFGARTIIRVELRQPTIAVPARQGRASSLPPDQVYAELLSEEEKETQLWQYALRVAESMGLEEKPRIASVDNETLTMLVVSDKLGIAKVCSRPDVERWGVRLAWVLSTEEISASEFGPLL